MKIAETTKRVSLSLTYDELYLVDIALMGLEDELLKETGDEHLIRARRMLRDRVLYQFNKWYDVTRAGTDPDYAEFLAKKRRKK